MSQEIGDGISVTGKCLIENCHRPRGATNRGLCIVCHSKARKAVESGATTWDELASIGLALPSDAGGSDPFTAALRKAKNNK